MSKKKKEARGVKDKKPAIKVKNLSKRFATGVAVDGISFEAQRGETLGLLGPNGAGKTTTMRILAGYLAATDGSVQIDGLDVLEHSYEVRKKTGYLPEHVPLYPEMRVDEYLQFRGRLKGLSRGRLRRRADEVKSQCGLHKVANRIIGRLSRGYHQRIGLADALIHEPELLLLDEPTVGLDPNQIRAIRELVKTLRLKHTVVLSTHYLAEAEMLCEKVLILNRGKIVAADAPAVLTGLLKNKTVIAAEIAGPCHETAAMLRALTGVVGVLAGPCRDQTGAPGKEWNSYVVECVPEADPRCEISAEVIRRGWALRELILEKKKFEDVFAEITGQAQMGLQ